MNEGDSSVENIRLYACVRELDRSLRPQYLIINIFLVGLRFDGAMEGKGRHYGGDFIITIWKISRAAINWVALDVTPDLVTLSCQ